MELDYEDLQPGISPNEDVHGVKRIVNIVLGVILVIAGIAMIFVPGPGIVTIVVGLNLIKPDNALVRYIRARTPGIPEDGPIPRSTLVLGVLTLLVTTTVSILWGADIINWVKDLF